MLGNLVYYLRENLSIIFAQSLLRNILPNPDKILKSNESRAILKKMSNWVLYHLGKVQSSSFSVMWQYAEMLKLYMLASSDTCTPLIDNVDFAVWGLMTLLKYEFVITVYRAVCYLIWNKWDKLSTSQWHTWENH
jgi:hypothetical protein